VLTGVAMIRPDGTRTMFVDRATVRVGELGEDRIREYIDSKEWNGKAGGYNLRDRLDAGWPITFSGDPTSIMGLPMGKLKGRLAGVVGVATSSIAAEPVIVEAAPTTGAELSAGGGR
jgi:septum formation protein